MKLSHMLLVSEPTPLNKTPINMKSKTSRLKKGKTENKQAH